MRDANYKRKLNDYAIKLQVSTKYITRPIFDIHNNNLKKNPITPL